MKAYKYRSQRQLLALIGGLSLTVAGLGVLPVTAQQMPNPKPATAAAPSGTAASTKPIPATTGADATDDGSDLNNWVTLGMGGTIVSGDRAQFQHQKDEKDGLFGGVEDFHWQTFLGKKGTFTVDGHGLFGSHDYDLKLDLTEEKLGYLRAGITEYRTWYDGNGGYFPPNNQSFSLYDNNLYIDRRSMWVEAGLTLPELPTFDVRYEHDSREGAMDSTSWGQTTLTGGFGARNIVPTYLGINEVRDIISGESKDHIGDTDAGLRMRYEIDRTFDTTYINQNPGQVGSPASRFVTDENFEKNNLFNANGFTKTLFGDKVTFSSGFSVSTIDTDLTGNRIAGPAYNSPFTLTPPKTGSTGFVGLIGGGNTKDYVGNFNLALTPFPNLVIIPAVRLEYEDTSLVDNFTSTSGSPITPANIKPESGVAQDSNWNVAESLEARYTGFRDWSLYATGDWSEEWGNQYFNSFPLINGPNNFNQDVNQLNQKYAVGANWYPLAQLNFGGQYYHEIHDYNYNNRGAIDTIQYPGYLKEEVFTTDDMNIRATWNACSTVSLITRYDFQYSTVDTTSIPSNLVPAPAGQNTQVQSSNLINHIISENVSWTPLGYLNFMAGGSYVLNSLNLGQPAGQNNLVLNGANNYWTVDASADYAINDKTDFELQYDYYRAADYINNSVTALPFGADTEEHSVTATISRQISKAVKVSLKYSYDRYRDNTSGGLDNYDAHLIYASTQFKF